MPGGIPQPVQGSPAASGVAQCSEERQALSTQGLGLRKVPLPGSECAGSAERLRSHRPLNLLTPCQCPRQLGAPLAQMPTYHPEAPKGAAVPQGSLLLVVLHQPCERRAQVLVFPLQPFEPAPHPCTGQPRLRLLCQRQVVGSVSVVHTLRLSEGLQALPSILADRLQHGHPRLLPFLPSLLQSALVHEHTNSVA